MGTIGGAVAKGAVLGTLAACCAAAAGCGGSDGGAGSASRPEATGSVPALVPAAAPPSWRAARIPSGAVLAYPPSWRLARGDPGSATAILSDGRDRILGYLNLTPRQGRESLANWAAFRVAHNAEEGERDSRREGARSGVRFRTGRGSCVRDSYTTSAGVRYVELACLVLGRTTGTVIVGAAPSQRWPAVSPTLARAISALTT
jgi:hypothetical protein